jgi:hypothetical protein
VLELKSKSSDSVKYTFKSCQEGKIDQTIVCKHCH